VTIEGNKVVDTRHACKIGAKKFTSEAKRIERPSVRKGGALEPLEIDEAISAAARVLVDSKHPLLYGWSMTTCEAQRVGIELAEELGGIIDNTTSVCHGPSLLAIQNVGYPTCTLGEIKNRADLVIYWGSNPMDAHPRHLCRYSFYPRGFFVERGRKDRTLIVVDIRKTGTAKLATEFIQVKPNQDYELISALRCVLRGGEVPDEVAGVRAEEIKKLVEKLKGCSFGVLFFGLGLTMSKGKHRNIDNAISLVRDLNKFTKFVIMAMRGHFNVDGFNMVLSWETGCPYAVDFSRGYPRYDPGETTVIDVLKKKEVDAALIVASDPVPHFPAKAVESLVEIPLISIDPCDTLTTRVSDVVIPAAISGIEAEGTAYRMDGVPLRLKKVIDPPKGVLTDVEILTRLLKKIREMK
jgi:formylmethanofuran dehydrogenase subunit B